jgi:sugar lactone lactonase YvrE
MNKIVQWSIGALLVLAFISISAHAQENFAAGFNGPENLAFDGKGNLYVSDTDHLFVLDQAGSKKELYARDPKADSTSMGGVSLGPAGKIYFSTGNQIKILDPATGAITVFVSGLKFANGNCFNDAGDLFIADSGDGKLYVVPAGSTDKKLLKSGMGSMPQLGVNGLVWGRSDNTLYYTQNMPSLVGGLALGPGPSITREFTVAKFPTGLDDLTLDAAGNLYVCLWMKGKLFKIAPNAQPELLLENLDGPSAVEFAPGTGDLYILIKGKTMKFGGKDIVKLKTSASAYKLPFLP